jgi:two-component system, cell cycle sensor histidine kinase and response regulator CckA
MNATLRLLIVEDSESDAGLIVRHLKRSGYDVVVNRVETATGMKAAIEDEDWDIVIADYSMPNFDALSALRLLQETGLDIPFIVVSGTMGEETAVAMMKAGAHDYVMKDNLTRLIPAVDRELAETEVRRQRRRAEESLRVETERFQVLSENAPFGMIMIANDGTFKYVNPKFTEIFGYDLSDVPNGRGWCRKVYPEPTYRHDVISTWMEVLPALARRETIARVFWVTCKDGSEKIIQFRPVQLRTGEYLMTCEDITDRMRAVEALRESEERYRLIVENTRDLIMVTDPDGVISYLSPACYTVLGHDPGELERTQPWIIHPTDSDRVRELQMQALRGSNGTDAEYRIRTREGHTRWVSHSWSPVFRDGHLISVVSVVRDISEHKYAEEALQIRDSAIASSISGVAISDSAGLVTYVNPAALQLWGYEHEHEVLGRAVADFYAMDERAKEGWRTATETGSWIGELITNRKDGSSLEVLIVVTAVKDYDGTPIAIMGSFLDITERKRSERALRESEQRYRALFEESRDAVCITTRDGVVEDANQAFLDLFGFTREEAHGMNILDVYLDEADRRRYQQDIERDGSVKDYPVKRRKKDGTEIDCVLTATARRDNDGTVIGYQSLIRDVTDWNRLQRQLLQAQKMEALGTLAGGIAHDFNNLLQVTMGYSEVLLSRKHKTDPEYGRLQQILQAGRSGAELVQRLLTLSRKTESKQRPIDLNHQIKQARKLLDRTIPKMIKIEVHLADLLTTVNADPTQVEQIIMNLVVNARDAMPEGGKLTLSTENVTLDEDYCRIHPGAKVGDYVLLAISDTGSGMDKEILDHIFEPFFTTKGLGQGTGLGLAVVYGIVEQHGGHVTCESQPGFGTSFKVYLPSIEEQENVPEEWVEEPKLPRGTETILLVDDEDVVRDFGELILREAGYEVLAARNGKEAVEIYRTERDRVALVILDLIMPEMGGKQCMTELLKIHPNARVLVASGYASAGTARDAIQLGARGFVNKPYDVSQMLKKVRMILDTQG